MPISLYNSLTRRTEPFAPLDPERVTMYLCGPTVYNYVHIGNARGPVVFDVLVRLLRRHYPQVLYARNITDVDDKINAAAQQQGVPIGAITGRFAQAYREDMAGLGVAPPDVEPHATTHIGLIIAMIESLLDSGHAYAAEGHVLFDVGSFPAYGALSGRDPEELIAGARVEVAPYKRNAGDFVLWKPSTPELPGWDSPWGLGRPGWHIECSAMSAAHLGDTIDIHAGGVDLLFPHHENEIAQSTCAHGGKVFARWWMHNGMLTFDGRKMSKSLGNVLLVHELLQLHPPEALRLRLLSGHYRQPLDWSEAAIAQATSTLDGWYRVLRDLAGVDLPAGELPVPERVEAALCDDLNTPQALAELSVLADAARQSGSAEAKAALLGGGALLGLLQQDAEAWFRRGESTVDAAHIEDLLQQRQAARAARDFARADAIRDELAAMHIAIEDSAQGTRWSVAKG
ncbi:MULTISPECIES: cysteine--tRNA ligase [unclassified Rhodanobacter]|uniref:cysteine--tRNA ligase n=1 Tax=unclassified Rhodanobacter TaxID=2621553 RepID=UPI001BDF245F|nr:MULTISPECIES: cysteine--tRNA ligase [unclassified Rhodanobacter]MBT2143007.1 cysteine--tRNA ligase [Rhodanobacter sp. LX-99]MBT2147920.1 cysteine--tRNA ligase [Rhodanobacter sp. LX-100]